MEIYTRKQLKFYIYADRMMNRGCFKYPFATKVKNLLMPDYIMAYLETMRKLSYYSHNSSFISKLIRYYLKIKYYRLGIKLSFNIGYDSCGYGLVIPHYGSLGVGASNRLGNYCVIHTLTSITDNGKIIGDALYLSKGSIITSKLILGDNISVGAGSVVNKSFASNVMIAGSPAKLIKEAQPWFIRDGSTYHKRVCEVEKLKLTMNI